MFSKTLFLFLVVTVISDFSYGQKDKPFFRTDYTYIESEQSFYKVHKTAQTFADAKRMCADEGASLFYAEDRDETNTVISFWSGICPAILWVFVGLSDITNEGHFETVDGRPISEVYSTWQIFQPDNYYNEDCVHLNVLGLLNDYRCDSTAPFICKKKLQSLERNYNCGEPCLGYTVNKDIGKCYKLHTTPLNWTDAYVMCRTEDASLAMISNHMEADYLAQFTRSTQQLRIHEQYQRGIYHLGFYKQAVECWQTVRGTPMSLDADFWFDHYVPDGTNYVECGAMFSNGLLTNTDCNMKSLFICERNVQSSDSLNEENFY